LPATPDGKPRWLLSFRKKCRPFGAIRPGSPSGVCKVVFDLADRVENAYGIETTGDGDFVAYRKVVTS
jgi:hypothetical protein